MSSWLKLMVVWLLALALPAQALTAATMARCGPSHERMHAAAQIAEHRHAAHDDSAADREAQADAMTELGSYKCSACGTCCSAHALPGAMPSVPALPPVPARFVDAEVAIGQELDQLMRDGAAVFHDMPAERFNIDHVVIAREYIGPVGK